MKKQFSLTRAALSTGGCAEGKFLSVFLISDLLAVFLLCLDAPDLMAQPLICSQPRSVEQVVGGGAVFTVGAVGTAPLSYQWRKNGVALTGATKDALILTNVQFADAAAYSVKVANPLGTVASIDATLSMRTPRAGDVDFSFPTRSAINHLVLAVAVQPDGKVLVGGAFDCVEGAMRRSIARLNADGSTDHAFGGGLSGVSADVQSIVV